MIKYNLQTVTIPERELLDLIESYSGEKMRYEELEKYYQGKNVHILSRVYLSEDKERGVPDNKIAIPYGRKLVKTIAGYLYKPGNIQYSFDGPDEKIREIYAAINEEVKTAEIRKQSIITGIAYELHYLKKQGSVTVQPDFVLVQPSNGFMIYDYSIEPQKLAFVRMYSKNDVKYYDVYYKTEVITYAAVDKKIEFVESNKHLYQEIPVIEHRNNLEGIGDIEPVKNLIDAYDVLYSDSMNEFDRFAWAYLLMMTDLSDEDLKKVKQKRIFADGIGPNGEKLVDFLTKDINHEFIKYMTDITKAEIHVQSFIPNVEEITFGGVASGVSIDKFIYMIEYTCTDKEAYTKIALQQRFDLLRNSPQKINIPTAEITLNRNTPSDDLAQAQVFAILDGRLSKRTLIKEYAPAVKDVDEELKLIEEEKKANQEMFSFDTQPVEEAPDEQVNGE